MNVLAGSLFSRVCFPGYVRVCYRHSSPAPETWPLNISQAFQAAASQMLQRQMNEINPPGIGAETQALDLGLWWLVIIMSG